MWADDASTTSVWVASCNKKEQKQEKISKGNLPNVGMGGWMEVVADKVHKQGEHIPQQCYISHNHPYISSSDTLSGTISISTATYVGIVV